MSGVVVPGGVGGILIGFAVVAVGTFSLFDTLVIAILGAAVLGLAACLPRAAASAATGASTAAG